MENKTITMPLSEYEWLMNKNKEYEEMVQMNIELQNAKLVIIDRRNTKNSTYQTRIYGKGVLLNKAIKELRDEVDKMYIQHIGYVEKWEEAIQDYRTKAYPLLAIKSKWWYKLFSKLKFS
jgi:hypothetical protein